MLKDSIIVALQQAMQTQGYLTPETVTQIARDFQVSPTQVYAVASFYQQFTFTPRGQHVIAVCTGTACFLAGARDILQMLADKFGLHEGGVTADGLFSLEKNTRCFGACAAAPVVKIDDQLYEHATPAQIQAVLENLQQGKTQEVPK